ncbi:uncharacterized protein STEHIDRAFT_124764 [Stereum hirsutum FP-91666 SS1]|uniref:uncharacterized protein n=1 Tax=Stereum hirsutum (strain FP-91666) TaxID=721885 RepID=UPI000444A03F|nr:uncharacterized protein STEHIDRAFT_124764 [Stereum hirsutum FP-91666 SS1]EIM81892.1 hypothetical protein STEHIDRAFT_124764 [Stereum hirsutum FP-91666 SS1]
MGGLAPSDSSGASAGSAISALLPTILALCGPGPVELVQLAFVSPIRALSTCTFGIGLPPGLFRQLSSSQSPTTLVDPFERTWSILVRRPTSIADVLKRMLADIAIIVLFGVMLWRNWVVCSIVMVTFRCEYSGLLLYWPVACAMWLVIAVVGLRLMARSLEIEYGGASMGWGQVLLLPYRLKSQDGLPHVGPGSGRSTNHVGGDAIENAPGERVTGIQLGEIEGSVSAGVREVSELLGSRWASSEQAIYRDIYHRPANPQNPSNDSTISTYTLPSTGYYNPERDLEQYQALNSTTPQSSPPSTPDASTLVVRVRMWHVALWGWYEAAIEVLAVGVYLYATIVLSSVLFLSGQQSMIYTVVMVLCLSGVRIISATT